MSLRPLCPELQLLAELELNENRETREEGIQHMKEWIVKQPHLCARTDDQWLVTFLRGCKFKLQRTKEKLDMYYTARSLLPEFFFNRDPNYPDIQEVLDLGVSIPLPTPDSEGHRIFVLRPGVCDPRKFETMLKVNFMNMDIAMCEDDHAVIAGYVSIVDLKGFTSYHSNQLSPSLIKRAIICYQEAYPLRPKQINVINVPPNIEQTVNFCITFVQDDIKSRVVVHKNGDMGSLHKIVNPEILPTDYGGCDRTLEEYARDWKQKVEQYRNWFNEELKYYSIEEVRTSKNHVNDRLGLDSCIRELHIS